MCATLVRIISTNHQLVPGQIADDNDYTDDTIRVHDHLDDDIVLEHDIIAYETFPVHDLFATIFLCVKYYVWGW